MAERGAPPDPVRHAGEALHADGSRLADAWLQKLQGLPGFPLDGAQPHAVRLVADIVTPLAQRDAAEPAAEPATGDAFIAACAQAGVELPVVVHALGSLGDILLERAAAELRDAADGSPAAALELAARIHHSLTATLAAAAAAYDSPAAAGEGDDRFESFSRTLAHELKNPLGAARGAAELLLSGEGVDTDEARQKFTELILRNVRKALELIDEIRQR
jgi:signal transduction histidine kinase